MSDELHSLRAIDDILARHDADEARRMLGWLTDKYVGSAARVPPPREPSAEPAAGNPSGKPLAESSAERNTEPRRRTGATGAGPPRETGVGTFDMTSVEPGASAAVPLGVADVDFAPEGRPDAKGYNDVWGSPDDDRVKCLEATHWFAEAGGVPGVTPEHIHAYFVEKGWEVPDDLLDTIDRAGIKGYLKTDDRADIRVALDGLRLMESSLSYVDP